MVGFSEKGQNIRPITIRTALNFREDYTTIDTTAATDHEIMKITRTTNAWQVQKYTQGTGWENVGDTFTANAIEIKGLVFNLQDSVTAAKSFEDLSTAGTVLFSFWRKIYDGGTQTSRMVASPTEYTDGAITSSPVDSGDSGNITFDSLYTYDEIVIKIVTSESLTGLEIPFEMWAQTVEEV